MARSNPRDLLTAPQFKGQPSVKIVGSGTSAGWTTINSGVVSAVVSTSLVKSDSMVMFTHILVSSAAVANTGSAGQVVVNSIVDGTSFAVTRTGGASVPYSTTVGWLIWRTT